MGHAVPESVSDAPPKWWARWFGWLFDRRR